MTSATPTAPQKYFKPTSLAWWSSVVPLLAGITLAFSEAIPAMAPVRLVINALTGYMEPAVLVNMGLIGIGLRGAMK